MTDGELSTTLSHVDQAAACRNATIIGPFSVFEAAGASDPLIASPSISCGAGLNAATSPSSHATDVSDYCDALPSGDVSSQSEVSREFGSVESPASHQRARVEPDGNVDNAWLITGEASDSDFRLSGHFEMAGDAGPGLSYAISESDETEIVVSQSYRQSATQESFVSPFRTSSISNSRPTIRTLDWSPTATMLMHHYAKSIVHLMQPVFHEASPFEKIYLPLAIAGSANINDNEAPDQSTSPSTAIFHSLLSAAASNMRSLGSGVPGLQALAWQHKQKALTALRSALASRSSTYRELMVAILSLVSADLLSGGIGDHWIHLEAARQLQASRHFAAVVSPETRQLDSICKMLRLFAQSTLFEPEAEAWPGTNITFREVDLSTLSPSIEHIYGITRSTAGTLLKTYRLTQMVAFYHRTLTEFPVGLLQRCEDLGDQIASWSISPETFSSIWREEEQMLGIARAQEKAFHEATRIYYYRSVQSCPREDLAAEQCAAIDAMNEAEDLKANLGRPVEKPAPITWPAFLASCEAIGEARHRWSEWWRRIQSYQMMSYAQQFSVVREIWSKLDEDQTGTADWREILAALEIRILPV